MTNSFVVDELTAGENNAEKLPNQHDVMLENLKVRKYKCWCSYLFKNIAEDWFNYYFIV